MAILKTNTLTGTSTAWSIAVTGEGNSTTTNLQQGLAKLWTAFDGESTVTTFDSFNQSSVTDDSTGSYIINFNNNMSNNDYSHLVSTSRSTNTSQVGGFLGNSGDSNAPTTSAYKVVEIAGSTFYDVDLVASVAHGDLA